MRPRSDPPDYESSMVDTEGYEVYGRLTGGDGSGSDDSRKYYVLDPEVMERPPPQT